MSIEDGKPTRYYDSMSESEEEKQRLDREEKALDELRKAAERDMARSKRRIEAIEHAEGRLVDQPTLLPVEKQAGAPDDLSSENETLYPYTHLRRKEGEDDYFIVTDKVHPNFADRIIFLRWETPSDEKYPLVCAGLGRVNSNGVVKVAVYKGSNWIKIARLGLTFETPGSMIRTKAEPLSDVDLRDPESRQLLVESLDRAEPLLKEEASEEILRRLDTLK